MILIDRGKLSADTVVETILPEFAELQVLEGFDEKRPKLRAPRSKATVRHLATHTSGLVYEFWNTEVPRYMEATGVPSILSGPTVALRWALASASSIGLPLRISFPQRPHTGSLARRVTGTRLVVWQWAQTTCRVSLDSIRSSWARVARTQEVDGHQLTVRTSPVVERARSPWTAPCRTRSIMVFSAFSTAPPDGS